jgi:hypothetical protein
MSNMVGSIERQYRLKDAAVLSGRSVATLRRKIRLRELGYRRNGKLITIPASEVDRLIGAYRPPVSLEEKPA